MSLAGAAIDNQEQTTPPYAADRESRRDEFRMAGRVGRNVSNLLAADAI
ncbi:MAG: hypothetical protein H0T75_25175 [Rhizobiales bacterium]|nr:hypothetical protein [Hyphomicrobiales bacterium]MDQ3561034.1 hypothetical protein [Pseudomonadota bacterium]